MLITRADLPSYRGVEAHEAGARRRGRGSERGIMNAHMRGTPGTTRATWPTAYLVTIAALTGCGLMIDTMALYVSIFATDSCGSTNPAPVCTPVGMLSVWALPWVGLGVAAAVSAGLGVWAWRRGRTPWVLLPVGVVLYVASLAGAWTIMTW
ncbi:hypothetical protein DEJ43_35430 [Streptomyces venezuelae ATCC 10712]|nr:hypothetical protein vnz_34860 [Streptomyces venezuelae]QES03031.1 hypothetical protein DEJ43_35430 [Streptomyces venezuelae ATCC 10712]